MKKTGKPLFLTLIAILSLSLFPLSAFAAGKVDTAKDCSLTICYEHEAQPLADAKFRLYRIAGVSEDLQFTAEPSFAAYPVEFGNMTDERWAVLANTLSGYVEKDALSPTASGTTDETGQIRFRGLKPGLYLALGSRITVGSVAFFAVPSLIFVPSEDKDTGEWQYEAIAYPKTVVQEIVPETTTVKALKIWNDKGNESKRPDRVCLHLLCDGELYDSVFISAEDRWTYTWNDLEKAHSWNVIEEPVENYTVEQTKDGITFCLTNTCKDTPPAKPTSPQERLPQTGLLWWPVPVLLGTGALFIVLALVLRKPSKRSEK